MRNKKEFKGVEDIIKLELQKEATWSKVMEVLLRIFEKHEADQLKIALEVEIKLSKEFDTAVIVR